MSQISAAALKPEADKGEASKKQSQTVTPSAFELGWVVQRLGAAAGRGLDRLQLHQTLLDVNEEAHWTDQMMAACLQLGWAKPEVLAQLDEARLPLVIRHAQHGWLVVMSRTADSLWQAETPKGKMALSDADLMGEGVLGDLPGGCLRVTIMPAAQQPKRALSMIRGTFFKYKGVIFEGVAATVLINLVALATSFYSMQVYDRVIPSQGYNTLLMLSLGVMCSILFELLLKYSRSKVMDHAVVGMDAHLSRDIFARLLNVRLDQLPQSVGSLAGQLRAYEGIRALLTASTVYLLVDIPFALLFIAVMGVVGSPYMVIVLLAFLLISLVTGLWSRRRTNELALKGARVSNAKTGILVEAVEGAETIKAGYGGWRFLSHWIDTNRQAIGYDLMTRKISEVGGYLMASYQQISYVGLVMVGAWQVMEGHMTMGGMIACSILSGRAFAPVGMIPSLMVQYAQAKAALDGLERIYALESDNAGVEKPLLPERINGNYRFESVQYAYRAEGGGSIALNVPQLEIKAGEKVGVLGPVGSGKSTLLRLLSGMYHPRSGRILLDDLELSHISRQRMSEQVGFLQQDHRLFEGSLRDNLLIGLPDPGDEVLLSAAKQTGLIALISEHPKGLALPIAEGGKGLSGGQKQLLALTRLVLTDPRVWLLDEPTSGMDDELERRCIDLLKHKITPDQTAVIVTHKSSMLPLVTRLIVIAQHRVVMDGPRDLVLQQLAQSGKEQVARERAAGGSAASGGASAAQGASV